MRDEEYLKNLGEISKWLDTLIVEINKINETVEDLIVEAPVSIAAWDKVGVWTLDAKEVIASEVSKNMLRLCLWRHKH
jgi:hypothetical protein